MPSDTRTRMIEATVAALQRQGVAGMSFTGVLTASGAARGAIYHHFPGGKAQLVAEAAARNGQDVRAFLAALPADGPAAVVRAFLAAVRPVVEASACGGGCAVAAVTVHAGTDDDNDALRQVAATAFASRAGRRPPPARGRVGPPPPPPLPPPPPPPAAPRDLAAMLMTVLQGAHVMCRAAGTLQPFDQAAQAATALAESRYPETPA